MDTEEAAGIDMPKVDVVGLPSGRHESFGAFVATTDSATMALTARMMALEQGHTQIQSTLGKISHGMQGIMLAVEQNTSLTGQIGSGVMALVSHVNAGNAALTASGIANLPAPLPVPRQVAIAPVVPTSQEATVTAAVGIAGVSYGLGNAHDASAAAGAASSFHDRT